MIKIAKKLGKALLIFIYLIFVYLASAYLLSRITIEGNKNAKEEVEIYILTNGVHTDIVVPSKNYLIDWSQEIKYANTKLNDSTAKYLAMGWGDKGFYLETPTWKYLTISVAFKAAMGLGTTAIHATYYTEISENESCKKINISKKQYKQLVSYITNSFKKDSNGHFMYIKTNANYGDTDAFYEANGNYSLFHTCNTWANNSLKSSDLKSCLWTPFDTGIFLKYE